MPVDNSAVAAPPAYQVQDNRGSGLQDSNSTATTSRVDDSPSTTVGASGTAQPGGDVTGLSTTNATVASDNTETATVTETNTATLVVDLPQGLDPQESDNPVAVLTAIELDSELLAGGGLSTDGPVAPPLPGVILGSLDLVRRDLEQMSAPLNDDTTPGTTDPLIIDPPSNDSGPVLLAAVTPPPPSYPTGSWSVPDELTMDPTIADRNSLFATDQAKRIEAFTEAQDARENAFNDQLDENDPLGALVASAGFIVSELVNTAAFIVTEFVNYVSTAITNLVQGISDWFTAPAVFTGMYGDPVSNQRYYQFQTAQNCVMMSVAMVINQLKENATPDPNEAAIVELATQTPSVDDPSKMMYPGLYVKDEHGNIVMEDGEPKTTTDHLDIDDGLKLLDMYGVEATLTKYDKTQGNIALRALAYALQDNNLAVTVGLHGGTIWEAMDGKPLPQISAANHQVVVIGVDFDARIVHVNDSGLALEGANRKVPLDAFMKAWQTDNYETVIAKLKVPTTSISGVTSTNFSGSTVLVNVG